MALRKLVLEQKITPEDAVGLAAGTIKDELYTKAAHDLVPELLNKLRESTLAIVSNGVAQSPTRTPVTSPKISKKNASHSRLRNGINGRAKRGPLFGLGGVINSDRHQAGHTKSQNDQGLQNTRRNYQKQSVTIDAIPESDHTSEVSPKHLLHKNRQLEAGHGSYLGDKAQKKAKNSSFSSNGDDSVIGGNSNTRDSSYADCLSGSEHRSPSGSNSKQLKQFMNGKNGKHFPSPNARSTPNSGRRGGHSRQVALGDYINFDSLDRTDRSSGAGTSAPKKGKKGRKGKKNWKDSVLKERNTSESESSHTFNTSSFEDFPTVRHTSVDHNDQSAVKDSLKIHTKSQARSFTSPFSGQREDVHQISPVASFKEYSGDLGSSSPVEKDCVEDRASVPVKNSPVEDGDASQVKANSRASQNDDAYQTPKMKLTYLGNLEDEDEDSIGDSCRQVTRNTPDADQNASLAEAGDRSPCKLSRVSDSTPEDPTCSSNEHVPHDGDDLTNMSPVKGRSVQTSPLKCFTPDKFRNSSANLVKADPSDVTHKEQLDLYVQLYSNCLDAHLVPSLSSELFFLGQLLIAQSSIGESPVKQDDDDFGEKNFFQTVHNVVYFAVGVLRRLKNLLKQFGRKTLQLLAENKRILDFCPELHEEIVAAFESTEDNNFNCQSTTSSSPTFQVTFQVDNDNRSNFPSDERFHQFKKMRDAFSELMKEWEEKQGVDAWRTRECYQRKELFENAHPTCVHHFARLFLSHLLAAFHEDNMGTRDMNSVDPEKTTKLTERLTKSHLGSISRGPCPPVMFPGKQRFFVDFLKFAGNSVLRQHISDLLVTQIDELNKMEFTKEDTESCGSDIWQRLSESKQEVSSEHDNFGSALLTLKLLARFLGHLTFLPYQGLENLNHYQLYEAIDRRSLTPLPLDLQQYLHSALQNGRLALTVPWVVEFLGMMDGIAPRTAPLKPVLTDLRQLLRVIGAQLKECGFTYSRLLVASCLGWLFEQPHLMGYYFNGVPSMHGEKPVSIINPETKITIFKELVRRELFFSCCPYFGLIRYLLAEFSRGSRAKTRPRMVNPIPPPASNDATQFERCYLETISEDKQLQEQLVKSHCDQLKRSHRVMNLIQCSVAYNFIRYLRTKIMPAALSRLTGENLVLSNVPTIAVEIYTETRNTMETEMERYCTSTIGTVLPPLLPPEMSVATVQFAINMAVVQAKTRIQKWMDLSVLSTDFHKKMTAAISTRMDKAAAGKEPLPGQTVASSHDNKQTTPGPSAVTVESPSFDSISNRKCPLQDTNTSKTSCVGPLQGTNTSKTLCVGVTGDGGVTMASSAEHKTNTCVGITSDGDDMVTTASSAEHKTNTCAGITSDGDGMVTVASSAEHKTNTCVGITSDGDGMVTMASSAEHNTNTCVGITSDDDGGVTTASSAEHKTNTLCVGVTSDGDGGVTTASSAEHETNTCVGITGDGVETTTSSAEHKTNALCVGVTSDDGGVTTASSAEHKANTSYVGVTSAGDNVTTTASAAVWSSTVSPDSMFETDSFLGGETASSIGTDMVSSIREDGQKLSNTLGKVATGSSDVDKLQLTLEEKKEVGLVVYMTRETQDLLERLTLQNRKIKEHDVLALLDCVLEVLDRGDELFPYILDSVMMSLSNLAVTIIFRQPSLWSEEIISRFLRLWKTIDATDNDLWYMCRIVCLGYIEDIHDLQLSLDLFTALLETLIKENLSSLDQIKTDLTGLMELPGTVEFYTSLKRVITDLTKRLKGDQLEEGS